MTEQGKRNIANISVICGLGCLLYFENKSGVPVFVGAVLILAGMSTLMFFELKKEFRS